MISLLSKVKHINRCMVDIFAAHHNKDSAGSNEAGFKMNSVSSAPTDSLYS